jgi:hypothetical protein
MIVVGIFVAILGIKNLSSVLRWSFDIAHRKKFRPCPSYQLIATNISQTHTRVGSFSYFFAMFKLLNWKIHCRFFMSYENAYYLGDLSK